MHAQRAETGMGVFDWLRGLTGDERANDSPPGAGTAGGRAAVQALMQRVLRLHPRVALVPGHARRLAPALGSALTVLRGVVGAMPPARPAGAAAWATDPFVHAMFPTAHDVDLAFSRSDDLRQFFATHPDAQEAFAVLGMTMEERRSLGVALEGDVMRTDVVQTSVSFIDHRVRICGRSDPELHDEIVNRMVDQLTLEAMSRTDSGTARREAIERDNRLLQARLRLLERSGTGMRAVAGAEEVSPGEAQRTAALLARNDEELAALGPAPDGLERQLAALVEVFSDADALLRIERRQMRLSRTNVVIDEDSQACSDALDLHFARVPGDPPMVRCFLPVRFARAAALSPMALLDEAERWL